MEEKRKGVGKRGMQGKFPTDSGAGLDSWPAFIPTSYLTASWLQYFESLALEQASSEESQKDRSVYFFPGPFLRQY